MDTRVILYVVVCIITCVIGYLIGKNSLKPKGDIVFETYLDEDDKEAVRCTFKLDMDIDEIVKEDYILFGVVKDKRVLDFYKSTENTEQSA